MKRFSMIILYLLLSFTMLYGQEHPRLSLTLDGVKTIQAGLDNYPLFYEEYVKAKQEVDQAIQTGLDVPRPKDMAGGYTHEQHKRNYKLLQIAGNIYQISGEDKYAEFVKKILVEYADMYPSLGLHPAKKSYARGKLFWQCLNDANWMVFVSQAYDCIYDYLSEKDRKHLENNLFVPFANFLSEENPKFFNRIHNHSTWANAAVGMMALAMGNDTLLQKALYGLKDDGIDPSEVDNDGGYIKQAGLRKAGFLAQLDYSFSPDGYFSEGPYYQRYAIFPFLIFSYALHNTKPDLEIFKYRESILKKATHSLLQLTNHQGEFFPINDAQKGMAFTTYELVTAVDLMYWVDDSQTELLSWAASQGSVLLNEAGFYVAQKITEQEITAPVKKSILLGDGVDGKEGGISILRTKGIDLLFKFSAQGMGHGHFDRLSYSLYNETGEVIQDYGAVRWVNVDQKGGGRYLPENKTFGKQSIAHNTLVVDEGSHYEATVKKAEKAHPNLYLFDAANEDLQVISAIENNAYPAVSMHRTFIVFEDEAFTNPLLIDLFVVAADTPHTYDLPNWYSGHMMQSNGDCKGNFSSLVPIGKANGYQHIWEIANCTIEKDMHTFNWLNKNRFYTKYAITSPKDQFIMGRAGANDPNQNLRADPVIIHRKTEQTDAVFLNLIEAHGVYSPITEVPTQPYGTIESLHLDYADGNYTSFHFTTATHHWQVLFSLKNNQATAKHQLNINQMDYVWTGPLKIIKTKHKK